MQAVSRADRNWARQLPWIDCLAALSAGVTILVFSEFLAKLYHLPPALLRFIGWVNAAYSLGGLSLGLLRTMPALVVLIAANLTWVGVCFVLVARHASAASIFGLGHLMGEGLFVGTLAVLEWRKRRAILT